MIVLYILLIHWVADFVFQKREWANNKSKSIIALGKHCVVYGLCLVPLVLQFGIMYWAVNSLLHFCIDFCTSKATAKFYAKKDYYSFYVFVGFDQMLHYAILFYPLIIKLN